MDNNRHYILQGNSQNNGSNLIDELRNHPKLAY